MLCLSIPSVLVLASALLAEHVTCDGSRAVWEDSLAASLVGRRHRATRGALLGTDINTLSAAVMGTAPTNVPITQQGLATAEEQTEELGQQVSLDLYGFDARLWRASTAGIGPSKHPFWKPEWEHLWRLEVIVCGIALFFAGILCSAGGIGGGGIYVTVLMVVGQLSVVDAVPLSKAVVFFGSISSLVLNLRKNFVSSSSTQTLIDYNLCRLVVPSALLGTYAGVFLNWLLPGWIIVLLLTTILCIMTATVGHAAMRQHAEEHDMSLASASSELAAPKAENPQEEPPMQAPPAETALSAPSVCANGTSDSGNVGETRPVCSKLRSRLTSRDVVLAFLTEFTVIFCSVLHFHAESCSRNLGTPGEEAACNHPIISYLGRGTMRNLMDNHTSAAAMLNLTMLVPACVCTLVLTGYTTLLVKHEGWNVGEAMCYHGMAIVTGALAGLVGIGGGLIFAPFFLGMGVEPSVAVATSSTCVIFTSSSTTLQYLLTDRIIMSLTLVYGLVNLMASYSGTSLVHHLQDTWHARRSFISLIVGAGVLISAVLSLGKLISVVTG